MTIKNYYLLDYCNLSDLCNIRYAILHNNSEHYNFCRHASNVDKKVFFKAFQNHEDYLFVVETATNRLRELETKDNKDISFLKKHCNYDKNHNYNVDYIQIKISELSDYTNINFTKEDIDFLSKLKEEHIYALKDIYYAIDIEVKDLRTFIKESRKYTFIYEDYIKEIPEY